MLCTLPYDVGPQTTWKLVSPYTYLKKQQVLEVINPPHSLEYQITIAVT